MNRTVKILVVNDDSIQSEGIRRLAQAATQLGEVWVVAPDHQCSAMSQKITIFEDIPVRAYPFPVKVNGAWSVGGTPADCVKAAVNFLLPVKPDYVFSGINHGFNAGYDVAYSGTIGAAMEGLMKGIPSIAFSNDFTGGFEVADQYLLPIMRELMAAKIAKNELWNVNFPGCRLHELKGILRDRKVAPMQLYIDRYEEKQEADGSLSLRNRSVPVGSDEAPEGTDVAAILNAYISIGTLRCTVL